MKTALPAPLCMSRWVHPPESELSRGGVSSRSWPPLTRERARYNSSALSTSSPGAVGLIRQPCSGERRLTSGGRPIRADVMEDTGTEVTYRDADPADGPARGLAITEPALSSPIELPWPARLHRGRQLIRGLTFAARRGSPVEHRTGDHSWQPPPSPPRFARRLGALAIQLGCRTGRAPSSGARQRRPQPYPARHHPLQRFGYAHESMLAHPGCVDSSAN